MEVDTQREHKVDIRRKIAMEEIVTRGASPQRKYTKDPE